MDKQIVLVIDDPSNQKANWYWKEEEELIFIIQEKAPTSSLTRSQYSLSEAMHPGEGNTITITEKNLAPRQNIQNTCFPNTSETNISLDTSEINWISSKTQRKLIGNEESNKVIALNYKVSESLPANLEEIGLPPELPLSIQPNSFCEIVIKCIEMLYRKRPLIRLEFAKADTQVHDH